MIWKFIHRKFFPSLANFDGTILICANRRMQHDGMEAEEMALMNIFLAWKAEDAK
jgi:hypothetical protein